MQTRRHTPRHLPRGLALLGVVGATTVMAIAAASPASSRAPDPEANRAVARPNIVVIMVDDMRQDDLKYMPWTRSLVAGRGVRFVNSLSPNPLCCPARASALTGKYTHNHRVFDVASPWGFTSFDDRSTLATWLRAAGYATVYLGKYLNGYGWQPEPGATEGRSLSYVPPGWTSWRASIDAGFPPESPYYGSTYSYFDTTLSKNGNGFESNQGRYQSHVYGELSERIIRRRADSDRPFFLYVSYTAPHNGLPIEPDDPAPLKRSNGTTISFVTPARPAAVKGRFDSVIREAPGAGWRDPDFTDKPQYLRVSPSLTTKELAGLLEVTRQRAESLAVVDQQVRRTIETLADVGELAGTVVLFTSDNGYFLGEQHRMLGKVLPHEPSLRVPMLVRGPGIPQGERRTDPISSMDIAPTLAEMAGVTPPADLDGASLAQVARTGDEGWTRGILTESRPFGTQNRGTDEAGGTLDPGEPVDVRFLIGVRTKRYLYVEVATGEQELYDLKVDPQQYVNLAADPGHADVKEELARVLAELRDCDGTECRQPLPATLLR